MNDALTYYMLKIAPEKFGKPLTEIDGEQRTQAERIAQKQLLIEDAVLRSQEAAGVVVPPAQVVDALQNIRARYSDDNAFERDLAGNALNEVMLYDALAREMRVEAVLDRISAAAPMVTETDARLYYYMNSNDFITPELREARHILLTINETFPENSREEAQRRLREIRTRIGKKPDRFAEQAMKHSECPTALQGGTLGKVKRGILYPELENVLFTLREGELSDLVETPLGFHLLLCEKIMEPILLSLEDVLPSLTQKLNLRERKLHQRRWIESQVHRVTQKLRAENVSHG